MKEKLKDRILYRQKYNNAKNELDYAKECFTESIRRIGEEIVEMKEEIDYYKKVADTRLIQIRKLKDRIKELEK